MASCVLQRSDGGSLKLSNVGGGSGLDLEGEEPVDLSGISVPSVTLHDVSWGEYPIMDNFHTFHMKPCESLSSRQQSMSLPHCLATWQLFVCTISRLRIRRLNFI